MLREKRASVRPTSARNAVPQICTGHIDRRIEPPRDTPARLSLASAAEPQYVLDDDVVATWTAAPLPWSRVQPLGWRGGYGLLLEEELSRAIRHESAESAVRSADR